MISIALINFSDNFSYISIWEEHGHAVVRHLSPQVPPLPAASLVDLVVAAVAVVAAVVAASAAVVGGGRSHRILAD